MTTTTTTMKYIMTALLVLLMAGSAMGAIHDVCPSGCTYTTIQAAVNNASDGDTINVGDGVYNENVIVNKVVVIVSENGSDVTTVIAQNSNLHTFTVTAEDVEIVGFTITGATGGFSPAGVYIQHGSNRVYVTDNYITGNKVGVKIWASKDNEFYYNWIVDNTKIGVHLVGAANACNNPNYFNFNNIERNGVYYEDGNYQWQVYNSNAGNVNMENNYWGTDNETIIGNSIYKCGYQCYDVDFIPILIIGMPDNPVPELPTIALLGVGTLGMIGILSRRRNE